MKKLLSLALLATLSFATVEINNQYVREVPPTSPNSAMFMEITNSSDKDVALVKATSNVAKVVELHTHSMSKGMMKMHPVDKIDIGAKSKTTLQPGGYHVMLLGLTKSLKDGDIIEAELTFSNGDKKRIKAPVKKIQSMMMQHGGGHHGHHGGHH